MGKTLFLFQLNKKSKMFALCMHLYILVLYRLILPWRIDPELEVVQQKGQVDAMFYLSCTV